MKVVILQAGSLPGSVITKYGDYPELIERALGPDYSYRAIDVTREALPAYSTSDRQAFIITGSDANAYAPDSWIVDLKSWIALLPADIPLAGICFGHQLIAHTFGGLVGPAPVGPLVGLHRYDCLKTDHGTGAQAILPAWHYDQVLRAPNNTTVLLSSIDCPNAAIWYHGRQIITFQPHPELTPHITALLIAHWQQQGLIGPEEADQKSQTLSLFDTCKNAIDLMKSVIEGREIL